MNPGEIFISPWMDRALKEIRELDARGPVTHGISKVPGNAQRAEDRSGEQPPPHSSPGPEIEEK